MADRLYNEFIFMPIKKIHNKKGKVPVKIWTNDLDEASLKQLTQVSELPFIYKHVAVMPDAHLGKGCTIGSVIPTRKAIIPAAVGVDIGCGMMAVKTNLTSDQLSGFTTDALKSIRMGIESGVPLGAGGAHASRRVSTFQARIPFTSAGEAPDLERELKEILDKHPKVLQKAGSDKWYRQIGSLGSGNHFIEICLDENEAVWVMLHSGSRGTGNRFGTYFIELAKKDMRAHHIHTPNVDLAYLSEGTEYFDDYVQAVFWSQAYASLNRRRMMEIVFNVLLKNFPDVIATDQVINCHHNYVEKENHFGEEVFITRKGAIRAGAGDLGIIPGSMGTRSFIVRGKGNPESFHSCSHGAGRRMSRTQARKSFTLADLEAQTEGVELNRRKSILDEIPGAYKDIDEVMQNQSDLVEPVHTLKQIICVKGD